MMCNLAATLSYAPDAVAQTGNIPWWLWGNILLFCALAVVVLGGIMLVSVLLAWSIRKIRVLLSAPAEEIALPGAAAASRPKFAELPPAAPASPDDGLPGPVPRGYKPLSRLILRSLPQPLLWEDRGGTYRGCNRAGADWLGLDEPRRIEGKTDEDLFPHPDDLQAVRICSAAARKTGKPASCKITHTTDNILQENQPDANGFRNPRTGSTFTKVPLRAANGVLVGLLGIVDNAATQEPTRNFLDGAKEQYRMAFQELSEGFAIFETAPPTAADAQSLRILDANAAFGNCVGLTRDELTGRDLRDLPADSLPAISEELLQAARNGAPAQFAWHCERTGKFLNVICYRMAGDKAAMLTLDMTARRKMEQEHQRLQEQLHQARKMEAIGQLAGGIAHDFNNMLTAIRGNAELIKLDSSVSADQLGCVEQILQASDRVGDLTQQLLAFGRKGKLQTVSVDLHQAICETVKLLAHSLDRSIEIVQELRAADTDVMGDPSQLKNTLLNLAINARDAMPNGGTLTFATRNRVADEAFRKLHPEVPLGMHFLEIIVRDTGVGMDDETRARVFEPFFTTKKAGEGTGLGLAGAYGCVSDHRGFIDVQSTLGRGTTFTIHLPLGEAHQGVYVPDKQDPQNDAKHILVVDDEAMVRNYAARILRTLGYRVSLCGDGAEAVAFFRDHYRDIDLVILDLIMPRMGGHEAYREMKAIHPGLRVLLASGYSDSKSINALLADGVLGFLNKPFQLEDLSAALAEYLEGAKSAARPIAQH